jgi:hypothetical protein
MSTLFFTEFMKVSQGSPQVVIDPKAPLTVLLTTKKECPSALGRDFKPMLLITFSIPN